MCLRRLPTLWKKSRNFNNVFIQNSRCLTFCSQFNQSQESAPLLVNKPNLLLGYDYYQRLNKISSRHYCSDDGKLSKREKSTALMDFPYIVWPNLILTIKNWFFTHFIIKPYYDPEFNLKSFSNASKLAFVKVAEYLSGGNFSALQGLIDDTALQEINRRYSALSVKQRALLCTSFEDIFFSFPYQLGIIFENEDKTNERVFVEITMCFHIFKNFKDFLEDSTNEQLKSIYAHSDRIYIANCRFIKEVTKGKEDMWTINVLNQFSPNDLEPKF